MNTCCPNGHLSTETDYCSECGIAMGTVAPDLLTLPVTPVATGGAAICPDCRPGLSLTRGPGLAPDS